ncbi:hypothetical protein SAMN02745248_02393 [Hathewaya proteolytica DSM 3090]|uniref:Uncharacterized protein n=1 Tax=Hathewaya proteolytica DSM 3090 TaxID=1121331 RepID=A0A1M6RYD4_9CLOT|nr:hypothetical protein [Hathewaya proteolytica]SHK37504.1 hypothetical protein SAMN02745248_02393 [Hathewaya proteolytica DSM 3090]
MKLKHIARKIIKSIVVNMCFFILCFLIYYFNQEIIINIKNYFFNEEYVGFIEPFKDLLPHIITFVSILLSMNITIGTLLLTMCDKRIMELIKRFKYTDFVIKILKYSIIQGVFLILLLVGIYIRIDFGNTWVRTVILILAANFIIYFFINTYRLIWLINKLLDETFHPEKYNNESNSCIKDKFKR